MTVFQHLLLRRALATIAVRQSIVFWEGFCKKLSDKEIYNVEQLIVTLIFFYIVDKEQYLLTLYL